MATYTVKTNQNLFDISLLLYGSIEGLFDLLISNQWLSMSTDLKPGMELEYHDYFVINDSITNELTTKKLTPANGERHVYAKHPDTPLVFMCDIGQNADRSSFVASGSGVMVVDWGDNSELEAVALSVQNRTVEHFFDNTVERRRIKAYGNFQLIEFDSTNIGGALKLVQPMTVDEYTSRSNDNSLQGLFLFDGTVSVDLCECEISSLLPIGDMSLQTLNLKDAVFKDISVLDEYLQYIVDNYGSRRNCTVYLTTMPSSKGLAAIKTILNEEAWNEAGKWVFNINGKDYTP